MENKKGNACIGCVHYGHFYCHLKNIPIFPYVVIECNKYTTDGQYQRTFVDLIKARRRINE